MTFLCDFKIGWKWIIFRNSGQNILSDPRNFICFCLLLSFKSTNFKRYRGFSPRLLRIKVRTWHSTANRSYQTAQLQFLTEKPQIAKKFKEKKPLMWEGEIPLSKYSLKIKLTAKNCLKIILSLHKASYHKKHTEQ